MLPSLKLGTLMELHYSSYFWILYQYFQLKIKVQFSVFDLKLITIAAVLMDFICFIPSKISLYFQRAMTVSEMNKGFPPQIQRAGLTTMCL